MKLHIIVSIGLVTLVSSRPQENENSESAVSENSDSELPADSEITEEELQKEEELEDYYDYSWKEQLMAPIRNVGQMVSGGVASAADSINTGLSAANEWWDGGSGDVDYEPYENEYDQVNNWWDAMEQEQYEYDEKEGEDSEKKETEEVDLDYKKVREINAIFVDTLKCKKSFKI